MKQQITEQQIRSRAMGAGHGVWGVTLRVVFERSQVARRSELGRADRGRGLSDDFDRRGTSGARMRGLRARASSGNPKRYEPAQSHGSFRTPVSTGRDSGTIVTRTGSLTTVVSGTFSI
jgi:hypothetical protein